MPFGKEEVFEQPKTRPPQYPHFETCKKILEGILHQNGYFVSAIAESEAIDRAIAAAEAARRAEAEAARREYAPRLLPLGSYARVNCPHDCAFRLLIKNGADPEVPSCYCVYADFIEMQKDPPKILGGQGPNPKSGRPHKDKPDRGSHFR